MVSTDEITCPMCGYKNAADALRCRSCGAKVEALPANQDDDRRAQQEGFDWKWAMASFGVYVVLQVLILAVLPRIIEPFDPQGLAGLMLSVMIWFVGAAAVGVISRGRTFAEPAVGALFAVIPTIAYLTRITPEGFQPSLMAYIAGALLGVMIALFGALLGEKIQTVANG